MNKRHISAQAKQAIMLDVITADWTPVFCADDAHTKTAVYYQMIDGILDKQAPMKSARVRADDPPWITPLISKLLKDKQRVYRMGSPVW